MDTSSVIKFLINGRILSWLFLWLISPVLNKILTILKINSNLFFFFLIIFISFTILQIHNKRRLQYIKTESKKFEQEFDIYSNDDILARQVCDTYFIQKYSELIWNKNLNKQNPETYIDIYKNTITIKFDLWNIDKFNNEHLVYYIETSNEMINSLHLVSKIESLSKVKK